MIHKLYEVKQAHALFITLWEKVKASLEVGKCLTIEVKPESKSREQEEKYHAMINIIAKQAQHQGATWDSESWKRLLIYEFARQTDLKISTIVPSLDGTGIVQLGMQSRKFTKEQATEFIEFLYAWGAQNGIDLR